MKNGEKTIKYIKGVHMSNQYSLREKFLQFYKNDQLLIEVEDKYDYLFGDDLLNEAVYGSVYKAPLILHKNDNKLDFSPENLYFGSYPQNGIDAHDNGSFDGTLTERKSCVARLLDGTLVKRFDSRADAADWLISQGFEKAIRASITMVIDKFRKDGITRKLSCSYAWTSM